MTSIQVDLVLFYGKANIAVVIDSEYKLLLEKHNNPVKKKQKFCAKSQTVWNFMENLNFIWKNMIKVPAQRKWL